MAFTIALNSESFSLKTMIASWFAKLVSTLSTDANDCTTRFTTPAQWSEPMPWTCSVTVFMNEGGKMNVVSNQFQMLLLRPYNLFLSEELRSTCQNAP